MSQRVVFRRDKYQYFYPVALYLTCEQGSILHPTYKVHQRNILALLAWWARRLNTQDWKCPGKETAVLFVSSVLTQSRVPLWHLVLKSPQEWYQI